MHVQKMVLIPVTPLGEREFDSLVRQNLVAGEGYNDISIFRTYRQPIIRGNGILSLISKYGRKALPFIRNFIFPSAKEFAKNVATDVIEGNSLKSSVRKRGESSLKQIGKRILGGSGKTRKRKRVVKRLSSNRKIKTKRSVTRNKRRTPVVRKRRNFSKNTKQKNFIKRKISKNILNSSVSSRSRKKTRSNDIFS